ncbi:MAG: ABC transporter ATP-binding protein [Candidatus Peregrinibacteria bacterium]
MKTIFLHYWRFAKQYPISGGCTVLGASVAVFFEMSYPFLYREIADLFAKNPDAEKISQMFWTVTFLALLYFVWWIIWRIVEFSISRFETGVMRDIEKACFAKIQSQSTRFFENSFAGSLVKKAGRFIKSFETIADWVIFTLLNRGLQMIFTLAIFAWYQPLFAFLFLFWIILFLGGNIWFALWKLQFDEAVASSDSACGAIYADSLSNNATVRSFGVEEREESRLGIKVDELYTKRRFAWFLQSINFAVQAAMMFGIEIILIFLMAKKWEQGSFSVGEFIFFQIYPKFQFEVQQGKQ